MQVQSLASWLLQTWTGEKLVFDFRAKLFWHAQRLSLGFHERAGSNDTAYRIQHDAPAIQYVTIQGFIPFIGASISFVTMVIVTARIDWQLAAIAVILSPALLLLARRASLHAHRGWHEVKELDSSAMSVLQEVLSSVRLVKAFGREQSQDHRFQSRSADRMRGQMRLASMQAGYHSAIALLITVGTATALMVGSSHVRSGALSLGELLLVMSYMTQLYDPLRTISSKIPELQAWAVSVERALALLDEAAARLGGIDAFVQCAGVAVTSPGAHRPSHPTIAEVDERGWDTMLAVNARSTFFAVRRVTDVMRGHGGGNVVVVGSIDGVKPVPAPVHYAASKGALGGMTAALAKELGPHNIRVNLVAPGIMEGGISRVLDAALMKEYLKHCGLRRLGRLGEVASVVAWLARHNTYVTGRTIVVDGAL